MAHVATGGHDLLHNCYRDLEHGEILCCLPFLFVVARSSFGYPRDKYLFRLRISGAIRV